MLDSGLAELGEESDEEAEGDECTRGKHEYERAELLGIDGEVEYLAGAEELADGSEECEGDGEAEAYADAVKTAVEYTVARGERLGGRARCSSRR